MFINYDKPIFGPIIASPDLLQAKFATLLLATFYFVFIFYVSFIFLILI